MSVIKRDPLRDILYLQDRMNRVFEESLRERVGTPGEWIPHVDIYEDDASITIKAELPGMKREAIMLDISDGILTISGKRQFRSERQTESYHMIERQYGGFRRAFNIPETVDVEHIDAHYDRGVLEVSLPKHERTVIRHIPVCEE